MKLCHSPRLTSKCLKWCILCHLALHLLGGSQRGRDAAVTDSQQLWPGTREHTWANMHTHADVTSQLACTVLLSLLRGQLLWALEPNGNWELENSSVWAPCPQPGDRQLPCLLTSPRRGHTSLRNGKRPSRNGGREGFLSSAGSQWRIFKALPLSRRCVFGEIIS